MKLGFVGLGRMGANMARRLLQGGHQLIVYNRSRDKASPLEREGAQAADTLAELTRNLGKRRIIWLMLPAGNVVDEHLAQLVNLLDADDLVIDGGNSFYQDDLRRAESLGKKGIHYLDAGISGGIWGLREGFCSMIGGAREDFDYLEPVIQTLAPAGGYLYCGQTGAGHFMKMVHNGIEYAMMEAFAEGFQIIAASPFGKNIDLSSVAGMWNQGSVIRSWLLELLRDAFSRDPRLEGIQGYVEDSGEARWAVKEAIDSGVAADVIASALFKRFNSRQGDVFANKVVAALRREFGGHAVARAGASVPSSPLGAGHAQHAGPDESLKN